VHAMIRFEPIPGKEAEFRDEVLRVSESSRAEPGCLRVEVFESLHEPVIFAIHSEWIDEAPFELHATLPHTICFLEAAGKLLTHPIHAVRLRRISGSKLAAIDATTI
jgi:quinol monooxygenase YgiN